MIQSHLRVAMLATLTTWSAELPAVNHWVANTGGGKNHVQNFIEDMVVYYSPDPQYPRPLVLTKSFWDEGSCGYCSYYNGQQAGKAEWWRDLINSKTVTRGTKTCTIGNFYGRAFLLKIGPPPKGDSAPYIACNDNDTIRSVEDPTALAFDLQGRLLVADNGREQNIKIFDMSQKAPSLIRTLGDSGGVFAGPVPGTAGVRRFWGPRGLGVDSQGNIYVGTTGMPMQVGGGTDIRVFSAEDTSLLWQVQGLAFVNTADADPDSAGRSVFLNSERFHMDLSKAPGKSWSLAAATIDPFRYPDDPRLSNSLESVFVRRIGGKLFLYLTDMINGKLAVIRFEKGSEIGIPAAFICLTDKGQGEGNDWGKGRHPEWDPNAEANKLRRWMWRDANGDGQAQASEFVEFYLSNTFNAALDIDERGDIWFGGRGAWKPQFKEGGVMRITTGGLDENGVPRFAVSEIRRESFPPNSTDEYVHRMKYLASKDAMFITSGPRYPYSAEMWRIDNWSDTARRRVTPWKLSYDDKGVVDIKLDKNTADMTLPMTFTADSQYVYVAYLDYGADARVRGEVSIYDAKNGSKVGWIVPGPETDRISGAVDLPNGINAIVMPDGSRTIYVEEDGKGKVMVYHWSPQGNTVSANRAASTDPLDASWAPDGALSVRGPWSSVKLVDLMGREVAAWGSETSGGTLRLPAGSRVTAPVVCAIRGIDGALHSKILAPRLGN